PSGSFSASPGATAVARLTPAARVFTLGRRALETVVNSWNDLGTTHGDATTDKGLCPRRHQTEVCPA
ncbi:hypothetical protein, partial [Streptomyces sp. NPDC002922]|uniref:hypothetical protein n=1 Tax=Streptomyces sp. NPDC002922 TaxID=3154439 RepID=UPI0033A00B32